VEEHRTNAYQGSSAMPHKRNPTTSERLSGLARLLRGYVAPMLEDVALWHERDLSHSSVERVALADSLVAGHYQVTSAAELVETLDVFPDRMAAAVEATHGLTYSSVVLTRLLADGMDREKAYRLVQRAADRTAGDFRAALLAEGVDPGELGPELFLTRHSIIRERLEVLRGLED
jgi:adenylosuccinate lyase